MDVATPASAQPFFSPAAITTTADLEVSQRLTDDKLSLSLMFGAFESRISEKATNAGDARIVRVIVPATNHPGAKATATLKGYVSRSGKASARCFVAVGDQFKSSEIADEAFELKTKFEYPADKNEWTYSIYIGCTRSTGFEGDAHVLVDTVDFVIEPAATP